MYFRSVFQPLCIDQLKLFSMEWVSTSFIHHIDPQRNVIGECIYRVKVVCAFAVVVVEVVKVAKVNSFTTISNYFYTNRRYTESPKGLVMEKNKTIENILQVDSFHDICWVEYRRTCIKYILIWDKILMVFVTEYTDSHKI